MHLFRRRAASVLLITFVCSAGLFVECFRSGMIKKGTHVRVTESKAILFATDGASDTSSTSQKRLFVFGLGYVGTEVALSLADSFSKVSGTCTNIKKIENLATLGIQSYLFDGEAGKMFQREALEDLSNATHILCTAPPIDNEDPVLRAHGADIRRLAMEGNLEWVGYLSSTGVYGDRDGAWVSEDDDVNPSNKKTKGRYLAETQWNNLKEKVGLPLHTFRLAGIYGPGRSALDSLNKVGGDMKQCGSNDQIFISRIHVEDIVTVLRASMSSPSPGLLINVADDLPSTRYDVLSFACRLLNYPIQRPDDAVDSSTLGVRGGSKRVDNSRMRALLQRTGNNIKYSDYRSGLQAIFFGDFYRAEEAVTKSEEVSLPQGEDESDEDFQTLKKKAKKSPIEGLTERLRSGDDKGGKRGETPSKTAENDRISELETQVAALVESNNGLKVSCSSLELRIIGSFL